MTERELFALVGKRVRIVFTDGDVRVGHCFHFTQALDNEPEVASIAVQTDAGPIHIDATEIESVEILK